MLHKKVYEKTSDMILECNARNLFPCPLHYLFEAHDSYPANKEREIKFPVVPLGTKTYRISAILGVAR